MILGTEIFFNNIFLFHKSGTSLEIFQVQRYKLLKPILLGWESKYYKS